MEAGFFKEFLELYNFTMTNVMKNIDFSIVQKYENIECHFVE